ncbi:MAG: YHS domain-containing protein [Bacteroidetes bacterium]|nr:YHS domain-containing protein [Bacteroidota bacterium]HNR20264.1 YHS domain-containing protein [Bacteroidia bacterium]HNU32614.1 YHS domain-containing protein [Bacteroidia bacterium]
MQKLILIALVVTFTACQNKQQQPEVKTAPALEEAAAKKDAGNQVQYALASDKDFICGMTVVAGECDTTMYDGKIYGFCSPDCKVEFNTNPAKYIKL